MSLMRVLAVGDIHGCSQALAALLEAAAPRPGDIVVALGDYVDRGPDSRGVIDQLLKLRESVRLVALRGNHEQLMLDARRGRDRLAEWLACGGDATLASYGVVGKKATLADVPAKHWNFLEKQCVDWFETATHFFVHGTADAELPLNEQPEYMLRWEKFRDPPAHMSGKVMVCGHTPQKSGVPRHIGHAVCIDTRAAKGGWLTCLDVKCGYMWQTNQRGELRTGWVEKSDGEPDD